MSPEGKGLHLHQRLLLQRNRSQLGRERSYCYRGLQGAGLHLGTRSHLGRYRWQRHQMRRQPGRMLGSSGQQGMENTQPSRSEVQFLLPLALEAKHPVFLLSLVGILKDEWLLGHSTDLLGTFFLEVLQP